MAYNFEGITILVIEDNTAIITLISDVLKVFGVGNIIFADNGNQGFKRACDYNPDIILTEIVLQELDGPDMIKKIRTDPNSPNPYVPIIIVTAFSELKRIETARDSGVNEILTKPFSARDLYTRIAHVIENPRQFVLTDDFQGPDRRRRKGDFYHGPKRRYDDADSVDEKGNRRFSIYTGKPATGVHDKNVIRKLSKKPDDKKDDKKQADDQKKGGDDDYDLDIDIDFV